MKSGIELITEERKRQVEKEGWTADHDNQWQNDELAIAGACYAIEATNKLNTEPFLRVQRYMDAESSFFSGNTGDRGDRKLRPAGWYEAFPFEKSWDKRKEHDRLKCLVIAGALIAAEIDRINNNIK